MARRPAPSGIIAGVRRPARALKHALDERRRRRAQRRWYDDNRRKHEELNHPADATPAAHREARDAVAADGVAVIPQFLAPEVVAQVAADLRPAVEALAAGPPAGPFGDVLEERGTLRTYRTDQGPVRTLVHDEGQFRIYDVEEWISPTSRTFFEDPELAALADSMTRTGMHVRDHYVEYKAKVGGHDPNVDYHIDHWKIRFKAFLLLSDVGPEQAPFVYVVGSHRAAPWRERWDWGYQSREAAGAVLTADQVARIRRKHGFEERVVTGRAGDLILANTRGIHRGTVLERGTRLQLVTLFGMNGPPEYAC